MRVCCIAVLIFSFATPALAQAEPDPLPRTNLIISDRAIAMGLEKRPPAPALQSRDSIKNGAIIGAVIGGVALAAPGAWICHMLREPGDPPCWKGTVTVGAIGAGIGAAVGAGIDAMAARDRGRIRVVSR